MVRYWYCLFLCLFVCLFVCFLKKVNDTWNFLCMPGYSGVIFCYFGVFVVLCMFLEMPLTYFISVCVYFISCYFITGSEMRWKCHNDLWWTARFLHHAMLVFWFPIWQCSWGNVYLFIFSLEKYMISYRWDILDSISSFNFKL